MRRVILKRVFSKWGVKMWNEFSSLTVGSSKGRAIAQAVSRRFPTAASRVRAQVRLCGICGGQSGTGARFLRVLSVSPDNSHSTDCSTLIIHHPGLVQEASFWPTYQVDSVSPHAKKQKKKKKKVRVNTIVGNYVLHAHIQAGRQATLVLHKLIVGNLTKLRTKYCGRLNQELYALCPLLSGFYMNHYFEPVLLIFNRLVSCARIRLKYIEHLIGQWIH
jgi:hypothetical protein